MQGGRAATACPPGDVVQDRLGIPEFGSISVMDGMLLQTVMSSCSFAS